MIRPGGKIRVVVADDSKLTREILRELLESEGDIAVVGEAANGREAIDLATSLQPDVLTMDLVMPVMTGMDAIREIMRTRPLPILVISSVANAQNAFEAMQCGALDVVMKPEYAASAARELVSKVHLLSKAHVLKHWHPRPPSSPAGKSPLALASPDIPRLFAIAASTGGPQALAQILPQLQSGFGCTVVIAQHISTGFAAGMAEWLNSLCKLPVRLVTQDEALQPETIYLAPSERHLQVDRDGRLVLVDGNSSDIYHPNCDLLLSSAADAFADRAVGIILSGMSSDGVKGIARIRQQGGATIAQDEATSAIYGMNRIAIDAGTVQHVLPAEAIAETMMRLARTGAAA